MRIRYGMVGGGPGAFIGEVHRMAASLDGDMELVAGVFSADPSKSREQGERLGLAAKRTYSTYQEMVAREAELSADERIHFVSIVTPNHLHFENARAFLEAGLHVVCDKPLTHTIEEAETLCRMAAERDAVFAVTYNYSGYPMVKQARALCADGALGEIRRVAVEYTQGWLSAALESEGHKQAEWRTDPARAGVAGALGDIGTHAEHLARYVTGLELEALCAELTTFVPGRRLEDDAHLLLRFQGGARGTLSASQISIGEENRLSLRVYGTRASLEWSQQEPETLIVRHADKPAEVFRRGQPYLTPAALHATRLPPGHPEGFIEAFANLYQAAGRAMTARAGGGAEELLDLDFPTVQDGAHGVHFVHRAVESGRTGGWVDAAYTPPAYSPPGVAT